jgi:hypothetical protein
VFAIKDHYHLQNSKRWKELHWAKNGCVHRHMNVSNENILRRFDDENDRTHVIKVVVLLVKITIQLTWYSWF